MIESLGVWDVMWGLVHNPWNFRIPMKKPTRMTHGKSSAGIFVVRVISLQIPVVKSWRVFHLFVVVVWRNKPPKRSHQLMVNWCFGAWSFGFPTSPKDCYSKLPPIYELVEVSRPACLAFSSWHPPSSFSRGTEIISWHPQLSNVRKKS